MSNTWMRPKIKIPKTKSETFLDVVGYSCFLGSIVFLVTIWSRLPEKVPTHYNAFGEVDRWGGKYELVILPVIGILIMLLMTFFEKFPETHNYPKRLNQSNAKEFYLLSRKLINQIKNICLIIFAIILIESVSIALGWINGFGWFLPIAILSVFLPIIVGIVKQNRIK
ncbi:DUF1648 domain-containing protein [Aquibacillus kalidii]|uniref:DUF1648 domain-containing protein n=1 Tax=Aquibacillus kalidii TaxID=2762597 RepID=UPI0016477424|nr:DUF1648 domain-containing protein [Aquibacillus kalidii]